MPICFRSTTPGGWTLKQWVKKLIDQLDYDWGGNNDKAKSRPKISEERATLLYLIDVYNKHLIDIDSHPIRRVRESLDDYSKELVNTEKVEDTLFRFRQYFSSYRVAEYTYLRKTFEDFKGIIWNFVEQLSDEAVLEQLEDKEMHSSLQQLKEAVEADSIDVLRLKSREFIHRYVDHQSRREERRNKRMKTVKKNLSTVKKQLIEADRSMRVDHLTQAYNRRSFDEQLKQQSQLFQISKAPVSMIIMDIDFFKKINDTYGHDIGDFVLKECVRTLQEIFTRDHDFVARIGGEEFAVILPEHALEHAIKRAEDVLAKVRKEVFIHGEMELRFTVSMGIAQLAEGESTDQWLKRADMALYESKQGGRNRYTVSKPGPALNRVA
jgi:diguanylate cyclase